ncbi:hypothetical protein [Nocardia brevicatena]|uniref:hypothetical protein n=1 Tax=Nocardia brevicatena TaxID=37327 RepID=UPI00030AA805|nr:hypothetical protein [Nocardia brevicatena]
MSELPPRPILSEYSERYLSAMSDPAPEDTDAAPVEDEPPAPDVDPLERFWTSRSMLGHIRQFARARRAGPWAVFGVVLARAVAATEPNMVLPPIVGSAKSLNLFVALVGPSGGGKGAAEGAAADAVEFIGGTGLITIDEFPVGSGEGIARTFQPGSVDDDSDRRTRAMFTAPEIDTLSALGARQGSTLMAELRKMFMGEQIGFANANKHTRTTLAAHSYRACLTVGVQPLKAGPLLGDADGGTPQRFLWLPVDDPDAPEQRPAAPEPLQVKVQAWQARVEMDVPQPVQAVMDRHRLAMLRGEDVDPLDGHRMLTGLKVAAALAILDGRAEVTESDWRLAGYVIWISDRTRTQVQRATAEHARKTNHARALAAAKRNEVMSEHAEERERARIRGAVLRCLERRGTVSRKDLRNTLKATLRDRLDAELANLIDAGHIVAVTDTTFRLADA